MVQIRALDPCLSQRGAHGLAADAVALAQLRLRRKQVAQGAYKQRQYACAFGYYGTMGIARDDRAARQDWVLRGFRQFDAPVCVIITYDRELADSDDTETHSSAWWAPPPSA